MQRAITAIGAGWGSGDGGGSGHGWSLLALEALALTEYEEVVVLDQKARIPRALAVVCYSVYAEFGRVVCVKRDSGAERLILSRFWCAASSGDSAWYMFVFALPFCFLGGHIVGSRQRRCVPSVLICRRPLPSGDAFLPPSPSPLTHGAVRRSIFFSDRP